jgi:hypothetical protein
MPAGNSYETQLLSLAHVKLWRHSGTQDKQNKVRHPRAATHDITGQNPESIPERRRLQSPTALHLSRPLGQAHGPCCSTPRRSTTARKRSTCLLPNSSRGFGRGSGRRRCLASSRGSPRGRLPRILSAEGARRAPRRQPARVHTAADAMGPRREHFCPVPTRATG